MKRIISCALTAIIMTSLFTGAIGELSPIAINSTNLPDKGLRKGLQSRYYNYDQDGDGVFSVQELKDITSIEAVDIGIENATGIGLFPYLTGLNMGNNRLKSIDLSGNPNLTSLELADNQLTSSAATSLDFTTLSDGLDLSACPKLEYLVLAGNKLATLDLEKNPALIFLDVSKNKLTSLFLGKKPKLEQVWCQGNQIEFLDIAGCDKLKKVYASSQPCRDKDDGTVTWGTDEIIIDRNTVLMSGASFLYVAKMWYFLPDVGDFLFNENTDYHADIITKSVKAYSDQGGKELLGTIPAYTSILVRRVGDSSIYQVKDYNRQTCYISSSALWRKQGISSEWTYLKLDQTVKGYQRPDVASASIDLKKGSYIAIVDERDGWLLVKDDKDHHDMYFYVQDQGDIYADD